MGTVHILRKEWSWGTVTSVSGNKKMGAMLGVKGSMVTLKGKAAKEFLKKVEQGPTERQKQVFVEADRVFEAVKPRNKKATEKAQL